MTSEHSQEEPDELQNVRDRVRVSITIPVLTPEERSAWIQSIRTYGERHWAFAQNELLSPIHCSRAGWDCIGRDLLQCRSCQHRLKVQFSAKLNPEAIDELSKEISTKQLFVRHDHLCPFYDIQHATPARVLPADSLTVLAEFSGRYRRIVDEFANLIESETLRLRQVPDKLSQYDTATVLALCGWQPAVNFSNVIECEICARALSKPAVLPEFRSAKRIRVDGNDLDVFEPIFAIGDRVMSRSSSPLPGRDLFGRQTESADLSVLSIDPIGDHRSFCPWVKGSSAGIPTGWETCRLVVERDNRVVSTDLKADQIDRSCRNILRQLRSLSGKHRPLSTSDQNET